jgi:amino acid transporter
LVQSKDRPTSSETGVRRERQPASEPTLRAGALKLPSVLMQGITHIAPAVGIILTLQLITSHAGVTAPLAYLIAFVIVLTLGLSLTQLAKHLASAGGYYTYVSRTVHPRAGFLTAWLYFLYDPTAAAINLAFMGYFVQGTLKAEYGVSFPWWLFVVTGTALITFLVYYGVEISARTMVALGVAEIAIVVGLALTGLFRPGTGGINFHSYNPVNASSANGLYLGVVFSIFAFSGFESVAPLAEESEDPQRNLPLSIIGSILLMGAFYLFCSWALLIGWGTNDLGSLVRSVENPTFLLGKRLWRGGWVLLFVAVINSILAVSIAGTNAATRVFFAMGRAGSLPKLLARVHPRYQTPVNAIWFQTFLTLGVGLGLGLWIGPDQEFYFMGVAITLGLVLIYGAGNLGVYLYYKTQRRSEFNSWLHLFFPLLSTTALLWVGYKSVVPLPPAPVKYAPWLLVAWLALGLALSIVLPRFGKGGSA